VLGLAQREVVRRHARDLALLVRVHHLGRVAVLGVGAAADLDEHEDAPVAGDHVELAGVAAEVALDDAIASLEQEARRGGLGARARGRGAPRHGRGYFLSFFRSSAGASAGASAAVPSRSVPSRSLMRAALPDRSRR
jgi:hypothetical protein